MGILLGIFFIIIFILVGILELPPTINEKVKEVGEIKIELIQGEGRVEVIKLVDDEAKKLLVDMLNIIIKEFNEEYKMFNLVFKKFGYEIIKDLEVLQSKVKENELEEIDMKKLKDIIVIFINNTSHKKICEEIMFEWDKKYMEYKDYGESPFYYIKK